MVSDKQNIVINAGSNPVLATKKLKKDLVE